MGSIAQFRIELKQTVQALPDVTLGWASMAQDAWVVLDSDRDHFIESRSRNALPGLKCGAHFPVTATDSPVLGLRPVRGAR